MRHLVKCLKMSAINKRLFILKLNDDDWVSPPNLANATQSIKLHFAILYTDRSDGGGASAGINMHGACLCPFMSKCGEENEAGACVPSSTMI